MAAAAEEAAVASPEWDWRDEKVQNDPAYHAWIREQEKLYGNVLGSSKLNRVDNDGGYIKTSDETFTENFDRWWWATAEQLG